METTLPPDPWQKVHTYHDLPAGQVISALKKEIRRGNEENDAALAFEMILTSTEMEAKLWKRLLVISVEDVGFGSPQSAVVINSLFQMHREYSEGALDRPLFAIHAVRCLCRSEKDRSSDELLNVLRHEMVEGGRKPEIPDYAIDMHTKEGQEIGCGIEHFLQEGSKVHPEKRERDTSYRERLLKLITG